MSTLKPEQVRLGGESQLRHPKAQQDRFFASGCALLFSYCLLVAVYFHWSFGRATNLPSLTMTNAKSAPLKPR